MRKVFIDEIKQKEFVRKGYQIVKLINEFEVNQLLEELNKLQPNDGFNPDKSVNSPTNFHLSFFDTNSEYKRNADMLIRQTVTEVVDKTLKNYRLLQCNFSIKPAGKGAVAPHLDAYLIQDIEEIGLVIWLPLIDVDKNNGTLWVVEGSQKLTPFISTPSLPQYCLTFEENVKTKYSIPINLKAGEAIIMDNSLLHWSSANRTNSTRPAVQIGCIPNNQKPVHYHFDPYSNNADFEVFELNNDFYFENNLTCFFERPKNLRSLGFCRNPNQALTEEEFIEFLEKRNFKFESRKKTIPSNLVSKISPIKKIRDIFRFR